MWCSIILAGFGLTLCDEHGLSLHNKSESFDPFVVIPDKVHASTASPIKVAMADDDEALWELDEETLESGAVG